MKSWFLLVLVLSGGLPGWHWLTQVREHNAAQARGQAALAGGQPTEAVYYYQQAVALAGRAGPSPALLLNLGLAQARARQLAGARTTYTRLLAPSVPAAIGSAARQQLAGLLVQQKQLAQAISLLRQALKLNPANATARYNYEVLSQYLAHQRPDTPELPPPATSTPAPKRPTPRDSTQREKGGKAPQPADKEGTNRPGQAPDPMQPPASGPTAAPQPSATGQPDRQRPTPNAGTSANGGFRPGQGEARPLPSGTAPGRQRGLDASAPAGQGQRPGTEAATDADLQLQTQRERLNAMNLTPAQAQQVLDALRADEQQYLQQRPRPRQGEAPAPGQPTW
ncbi:tetratricopeptide repeat protein [Hymenobacter sp. H14-R3]|uniref:tetratricopeptide repeat protein n=1 Tax=Hymenobacter sp. H14-R3 TaxID=3046308 RepID=UPI0024B9D900|nr:tetratricopeptide repeat protein [Hymenobacter sp. H14-R3]MDJ0364211.1 tetratricopeptide repeat protein [Hymenobacter sp. H14-R3]